MAGLNRPGAPAVNLSPDRPLRIGVLGAATIARLFAEGVRASRKIAVTAVASRNVDRATAFARVTGIALVHPTYAALLGDPEIKVDTRVP